MKIVMRNIEAEKRAEEEKLKQKERLAELKRIAGRTGKLENDVSLGELSLSDSAKLELFE